MYHKCFAVVIIWFAICSQVLFSCQFSYAEFTFQPTDVTGAGHWNVSGHNICHIWAEAPVQLHCLPCHFLFLRPHMGRGKAHAERSFSFHLSFQMIEFWRASEPDLWPRTSSSSLQSSQTLNPHVIRTM